MKKSIARTFGQKNSTYQFFQVFLLLQTVLLFFSGMAGIGYAQITVTGISNQQVYANSVSFTVVSESGYDYTATLNDTPVAVGSLVTVDTAMYYELYVSRTEQSTGTEESLLIQFIVRATERANTEWGLPVFTPYPMIDSAAAEFTGSHLEIVTPAAYPIGLEIPVIARVESPDGKRTGVNGRIQAAGFENYPLQLFRGVGSVFLPAATEPGILSYAAQIQSLSSPKQITIESGTAWQTVSGSLAASADWGQNARVQITGDLTIPAGVTLTIGAASVIVIGPDVEITLNGRIIVNGTNQQPVVFTTQDRSNPWGGFICEAGTSQGDFSGCIFTASGADASWFSTHSGYFTHQSEQCLFLVSNDAHVTLTDCYMVENAGQIGHGEHGYLTMTGCLMQKAVTVGQYNNGSVTFEDCALIEFPPVRNSFVDDDNDCIYLSGGPHLFTDCLFGWTLDDGIDAGQGDPGAATFTNCWFESIIHEAMACSSGYPRNITATGTVAINCGQGIECGYGEPLIDADNCLCTANAVGVRFGDNYDDRSYDGFIDVQNSLLLYNWRDIWGRAWDNWQLHLSQMNIQNNYISVTNDNHPDNMLWNPQSDANQLDVLEVFLPVPAGTVGVGIATIEKTYDLSELNSENLIPVRLSTFTTQLVSVNYTVSTNLGILNSGILHFNPGQTVQQIEFAISSIDDLRQVRITLSDPVNAEVTRYSQVIFEKPYEIAESLIVTGDSWSYFKGTSEPPVDWNQTAFDDSTWLTGPSGFGYENSSGYEDCIATNLSDMRDSYYSVYSRRLFWIDDSSRVTELTLGMEWDDGYIAYLNGIQIDSQYPPNPVAYNEPASSDTHEACCGSGCTPRQVDLASYIGILNPGFNVLAVQAHNGRLSSSDFLFIPTLSSVSTPYPGDVEPDGDVDLTDLEVFAQAWLAQEGQNQYNPVCDLNSAPDGSINLLDFEILAQNWLRGQ